MTKNFKKMISCLVIMLMVISIMPIISKTVEATSTDKAMMMGTSGIGVWDKDNATSYLTTTDKIVMGRFNSGGTDYPVTWVMIDESGLMLSEYVLEQTAFEASGSGYYPNSTLNTLMSGYYDSTLGLTTTEKTLIKDTTLSAESMYSNASELTRQTFFPLSQEEVNNHVGTSTVLGKDFTHICGSTSVSAWWLRSSYGDGEAFSVHSNGGIGDDRAMSAGGSRPAFNLDTTDILFTSAAVGGKSGAVGSTLTEVLDATSTNWKMTVKDDNHTLTTATSTSALTANSTVAVNYTGASTGHTLSAMVVNRTTNEITSYGNVASDLNSDTGTVDVTLPSNFDNTTHKLVMFTETLNGDNKTDFASEMVEVSPSPTYSGGKGTEFDPFLISNLSDLETLSTTVNDGEEYLNTYFKQTTDITVINFNPIGGEDWRGFSGVYDGANHTISGSIGDSDEYMQGLFGMLNVEATVKNLNMNASVVGNRYVGAVAGINEGEIINCSNSGTIGSTNSNVVGGIVGDNFQNCGTIDSCFNTGNITGENCVGGITGGNRSLDTVKNSYNTGKVTGTDRVGGIVGDNTGGRTANCYNIGTVIATGSNVGAVVGFNNFEGEVINCYYNNEVYTVADTTVGVSGKTTVEMTTREFTTALNSTENKFSYKTDSDHGYYPYITALGEVTAQVAFDKIDYTVIEGDNQTLTVGYDGTITFKVDGDFAKFEGLYLNGELVDESNYEAKSGSVIITLKADYVKTLPVGKHVFTVAFTDGEATVNMEVKAKSVPPTTDDNNTNESTTPPTDGDHDNVQTNSTQTGDNTNVWLYLILALVSLSVVGYILVRRKNKDNKIY